MALNKVKSGLPLTERTVEIPKSEYEPMGKLSETESDVAFEGYPKLSPETIRTIEEVNEERTLNEKSEEEGKPIILHEDGESMTEENVFSKVFGPSLPLNRMPMVKGYGIPEYIAPVGDPKDANERMLRTIYKMTYDFVKANLDEMKTTKSPENAVAYGSLMMAERVYLMLHGFFHKGN